jgi:excisionase family DNA binding protein
MKKQQAKDVQILIPETGLYYSVAQAAQQLNLTRQAVNAAIRRGDIPAVETPWGHLVHKSRIEDYKNFRSGLVAT